MWFYENAKRLNTESINFAVSVVFLFIRCTSHLSLVIMSELHVEAMTCCMPQNVIKKTMADNNGWMDDLIAYIRYISTFNWFPTAMFCSNFSEKSVGVIRIRSGVFWFWIFRPCSREKARAHCCDVLISYSQCIIFDFVKLVSLK